MDNRKPIYSKDHADRRVISSHNGLWTPQRRVSHTPGCNRGYIRTKIGESFVIGIDRNAPHSDPWQDIHMPCDKVHAMATAFGPKVASQIV